MMNQLMRFAMASDAKYLKYVPSLVNSIGLNHPATPIRIHLLVRGVPVEQTDQLKAWAYALFPNIIIETHDIATAWNFAYLRPCTSHLTVATMDRLLIPDLLPGIERILYLDIDTYVRQPLTDYYTLPLGDKGVCGVHSQPEAKFQRKCMWHATGGEHGYGARVATNAGVIIMNPKLMIKKGFIAFRDARLAKFKMFDQVLLNWYLQGQMGEMPAMWNTNRSPARDNVVIYHGLGGPNKPWMHTSSGHADWKKYEVVWHPSS